MIIPTHTKPRCVTYVRKQSGITATVVFTHLDSFLGIRIDLPEHPPTGVDSPRAVTLYNFYSPGRPTAVANLLSSGNFVPDAECLIMGDFNAHDSWWYGAAGSVGAILRNFGGTSKTIEEWFWERQFTLHNEVGHYTHFPRNGNNPTIIDLCFSKGKITEKILTWAVDDNSTSDHSACGVQVELGSLEAGKERLQRNWKSADWELFSRTIRTYSTGRNTITSAEGAATAATEIIDLVRRAIDLAVPLGTRRAKTAPWWTAHLSVLRRRLLRCERRFKKVRSSENQADANNLRSEWKVAIRKAKHEYWNKRLSEATPESIWGLTRRHDAHKRPIPNLQGNAFP